MRDWNKLAGIGPSGVERRREERQPVDEEILLTIPESGHDIKLSARVVDTSRSGFRIMHYYPLLRVNQDISFRHYTGWCASARVMWTRRYSNCIESGCLILEKACRRAEAGNPRP